MLKPLSSIINFSYLHAQNYYISDHFKDFRSRVIVLSVEGNDLFFSFDYLIACVRHFVYSERKRKISLEPYRKQSSYICTYTVTQ